MHSMIKYILWFRSISGPALTNFSYLNSQLKSDNFPQTYALKTVRWVPKLAPVVLVGRLPD